HFEDDRNHRCCLLRRQRGIGTKRGEYGYPNAHQLGSKLWQSIVLLLRPTVFDRDALTLAVAGFQKTLSKSRQPRSKTLGRPGTEITDYRQRTLLRARRQRPKKRRRRRRAADERDERAASHSITSSARASRFGGTSRPSTLAAWALITSSILVDCTTGS